MNDPTSSKLIQNLFLLFATILAGVILMEMGLRLVDSARGTVYTMQVLADDGEPLCKVIPNLHLTTVIDGEEIVVETNELGMRWREVERTRSSSGPRIAFVGDSFTFGEWSPNAESSFVGIVDSYLRPLGVDVLNFGVPGDGPIEQEQRLIANVLSFEPDYVVLNIFNGNDFSDTGLGIDKTDCETGDIREGLVRSKVPAEYLETRFQVFKRKLDHHSRLFQVIRLLKGRLTGDVRFVNTGDQTRRQADLPIEDRFFKAAFWSRTDYPPVAIAARDEMIETLGRIHNLSLTNGFKLILTAIPFREQVYTAAFAGEGYDLALPQRHVAELAASRAIPYYDLLPDFRRHVNDCGSATYVSSDPHFNGTGHRLAGKLITRFLFDVLEIDERHLPAIACDFESRPSEPGDRVADDLPPN